MSRWADWLIITMDQYMDLADAEDEDEVEAILEPLLEQAGNMELPATHHLNVDRLWEPLHRALNDDHTPDGDLDVDSGDYPLCLCVLGGEAVFNDGRRYATVIDSEEVADLLEELQGMKRPSFAKKFFALPDDQFHELSEDVCAECWELLKDLRKLLKRAKKEDAAMLCSVSL